MRASPNQQGSRNGLAECGRERLGQSWRDKLRSNELIGPAEEIG